MRTTPRPPISAHRLARLHAWARLWLIWFVGMCAPLWSRGIRARELDSVARGVAGLVLHHAALRIRAHTMQSSGNRHGRLHHVTLRRMMGARLRRALRGRDWASRLFAILAVMRDCERHVARRLRRGLSRLRIIDLKPERAASLAAAPAFAIACNDSS